MQYSRNFADVVSSFIDALFQLTKLFELLQNIAKKLSEIGYSACDFMH